MVTAQVMGNHTAITVGALLTGVFAQKSFNDFAPPLS